MQVEIENFVRYSIRYQILLAQKVANCCATRVYVFDNSNYFNPIQVETELIENIRTVTREGHRAVLSIAVQEAFGSNDDLFLKFVDEGVTQEDDIGLYVIAPKIMELVDGEPNLPQVAEEVEICEEKQSAEVKGKKEPSKGDDLKDISKAINELDSIL